MAIYAIAQGRVENRDMLDQYVAKVMPTLEGHPGRIVAFDEAPEAVEGEVDLPRTVVLEFPSREAFRAWYDSPEYQAILPLRIESTPGRFFLVEGF